MQRPALTGSRIRRHRLDRGIRQADLARGCDISPSYLNLIEHNRRRIGGALLNRIARVLDMDPAALSEGAESALVEALEAAAADAGEQSDSLERAEEFAGRFPGWARLLEDQSRRIERLERVVQVLTDRLTHDPQLSASLHDVLTTVTAIRSTSGILAAEDEIEPQWRARFHRNLYEDSQRLAGSAEALVSFLDAGGDAARTVVLPHDEVEAWLADQDWTVDALERGAADADDIAAQEARLTTPAAKDLAKRYLRRYRADADRVPQNRLIEALSAGFMDPAALAGHFGVEFDMILRRLASLPGEAFENGISPGLVLCDGSGTLTFRKAVPGFEPPRFGAACPLWPLYQALQRPSQPIRAHVVLPGRDTWRFTVHAIATSRYEAGFNRPPVVEATMLVVPVLGEAAASDDVLTIGTSCRICAVADCAARREPSILSLAQTA
ncbi:MAG: short-chain fatty acyl-CoA regulator family protein [Paracoccaceae bacterium]|nr:short-chain fatty acyl-CoA regulator family protein [Paracoccaceae bacterium]